MLRLAEEDDEEEEEEAYGVGGERGTIRKRRRTRKEDNEWRIGDLSGFGWQIAGVPGTRSADYIRL
jgi:hypothetical protein